jgi:hypothetical protein
MGWATVYRLPSACAWKFNVPPAISMLALSKGPKRGRTRQGCLYCTVLYCTVLYLYAWKLFYGLLERGGLVQQMGENLQYQYWQAETPAPYSSIVETR